MDTNSKPVLAMYDIRGKQAYIYRSAKLKEIIGGSLVIRDCFRDYLYPAGIAYRNSLPGSNLGNKHAIYNYADETDNPEHMGFSFARFEQRMKGGQYIGEVVYDGGGNFLILFKDESALRLVTNIFTRKVIQNTGTLRVLCTYITDLDPENFHAEGSKIPGDYERLYQVHRYDESQITAGGPYGTLPIVQAEYKSSQPLTHFVKTRTDNAAEGHADHMEKVTTEAACKYKKYWEEIAHSQNHSPYSEMILDNIVKETRGEDSMLAVVYIDGNSMGARVQQCLKDNDGNAYTSYDDCIRELRGFSAEIQKTFIDDRKGCLNFSNRVVIGAGDEITIICRADEAYQLIRDYLKDLPSTEHNVYSSCAGAAIFHSHAPFADAYRIAEECCENGKKYMKNHGLKDTCLMDFEYCQGAIGISLNKIREENGESVSSRPWLVTGTDKENRLTKIEDVEQMRQCLEIMGHSNIKSLAQPAELGGPALRMELRRILAHMPDRKKTVLHERADRKTDEDTIQYFLERRMLVKDLVRMYDEAFGVKEKKEAEGGVQ